MAVLQIAFVQDFNHQAKRDWRDDPLPRPAVLVNWLLFAAWIWLQYFLPVHQQLLIDSV